MEALPSTGVADPDYLSCNFKVCAMGNKWITRGQGTQMATQDSSSSTERPIMALGNARAYSFTSFNLDLEPLDFDVPLVRYAVYQVEMCPTMHSLTL
jgi:hypothetical protein